jgi:His-Xaa-Ser system protein HxsD
LIASTLNIDFDQSVYSIEAVQKATYRAINVMSVFIETDNKYIKCKFESSNGVSQERFELAIHEFKKDLIDEELRIKIKKETQDIRNLILGLAFSRTSLQSNE